MDTLQQLRRRLDSADDLRSVVKTMKTLAAVGIRQYEEAAVALAEYDRTVRLGLQAVLRDVGLRGRSEAATKSEDRELPRMLVAFGSDQGMCGQLNDAVAERLEEERPDRQGELTVLASGGRLASILDQRGPHPRRRFDTPTSIEAVSDAAVGMLVAIEEVRSEHGDLDVHLVFPRRTSGAGYEVRSRRILPLDRHWIAELRSERWPTRVLPAWPDRRRTVLRALVREYLFVSLYRALVDTLASEHASRLSSMQSAERNIEERLDELRQRYRRQRQTSITSELMDVVAGFEALSEDDEEGGGDRDR